jgi:2-polyprenyl-6-methoxyphenol hydroxylase-like FAD-dependent oxidoreductase
MRNDMRILISGAGLAGPTVAYWLSRYGFNPTLVEQAPSIRTGGYKIDVRGVALQVLRHMGIYEAVANASTDMQGAYVVDQNGRVITEMSADDFGLRQGDDLEILRQSLCEILMAQIPHVKTLFADSIKSISQTHDRVLVEFEKAPPDTFDLVIGADGLHSNVRRLVFGNEELFAKNLSLYLCVFSVPNTFNLDRQEMEYMDLAKGRLVNIWSSRGDVNARAAFGFASSLQVDPRDIAQQQQLVNTIYSDLGWQVPNLLQAMPSSPDFYFDSATQIEMSHFCKQRVALIGDAGYCPSPMSGQGTSLALVGAYVLAGELAAASGDHLIAFANYEKEMSSFIKCNQAIGIRSAKIFRSHATNRPMAWLHEQLMRFMPGRLVQWITSTTKRRIARAANAIILKDYSRYRK